MKMTIKEFGEQFDIPYAQASGAVAFLVSLGVAKKSEEVYKEEKAGRGKRSSLYEFPAAKTIIFDQQEYERLKKKKGK